MTARRRRRQRRRRGRRHLILMMIIIFVTLLLLIADDRRGVHTHRMHLNHSSIRVIDAGRRRKIDLNLARRRRRRIRRRLTLKNFIVQNRFLLTNISRFDRRRRIRRNTTR